MTTTTSSIDTAAQQLSDASWGNLGGGFLVFNRADWGGGAWYKRGSRPKLGNLAGCITVPVPSRSITVAEAKTILEREIAE